MNSMLAVWSLFEKHFIYIEFLLQEIKNFYQIVFRNVRSRFRIFSFSFVYSHSHHRASKVFFQRCSLSLSYSLLYILTRIIEHREFSRESCHPRGLDLPLIQDDRIYPTTASFFDVISYVSSFSWAFVKYLNWYNSLVESRNLNILWINARVFSIFVRFISRLFVECSHFLFKFIEFRVFQQRIQYRLSFIFA